MGFVFECYNNEILKKEIYEKELEKMKNERDAIHSKHLGGGNPFAERVQGGKSLNSNQDNMINYIDEVNYNRYITLNGEELSVNDYINKLEELIEKQKLYIEEIEEILKKLEGRPNELFCLIQIEGLRPTKAVEKLANKYGLDTRNVWKREYKKIKKYLKKYNN